MEPRNEVDSARSLLLGLVTGLPKLGHTQAESQLFWLAIRKRVQVGYVELS